MKQKSIIPSSVRAGERNWLRQFVKHNKFLYPLFYKLLRCNRTVFILNGFWRNTDILFDSVEIETISICNRKCSFCPLAYDDTPGEIMADETFDKIINELKELNFKGEIAFSGYGEPLLDKQLRSRVEKIKKELGSFIEIVTNGDFLTYKKFKELVSMGVNVFRLSQHGKEPSEQIKLLFSNIKKDELKYV